MRVYQSPDGTLWGVDVKVPSFSNAMVLFKHPDGDTARRDRYGWYLSHSPESHDPRARLSPAKVLAELTEREIATLYRRSMPVTTTRPRYDVS